MADTNEDRPMTEAEWERFMQQSDARSARYGELLETLMNHPQRDEIIDREMGWNQREPNPEFVEMINAAAEEALNDTEQERSNSDDDDHDALDGTQGYLDLPAYQRAFDWGLRVSKVLEPFVPALEAKHDLDVQDAVSGSLTVAAKIAGGSEMGDDERMLGGCIVRVSGGLDECQRALAALAAIAESGVVSGHKINELISDGREVKRLVNAHIAELRSRVWWE